MIVRYLLLALALMFIDCAHYSSKKPPEAVNGVLDLRNWDFEKDGLVQLKGEWEFYFNQLLDCEKIKSRGEVSSKSCVFVPHKWRFIKLEGKKLRGDGYATYHLKILCNKPEQELGVNIVLWSTAYKLYSNGELLSSSGVVDSEPSFTSITLLQKEKSFIQHGRELDLVLQLAEFEHYYGGFWPYIEMGSSSQMEDRRMQTFGLEMFIIGFMVLMAIYHLALFVLGRREREYLAFALFVIFFATFLATYHENVLLRFFPDMQFKIYSTICGLSSLLTPSIGFLFFSYLFPKEFPKKIARVWIIGTIGYCLAIAIFPGTFTAEGYDIYTLIANLAAFVFSMYVIIGLFVAVSHKKDGAGLLLFGGLILGIAIIYDGAGNLFQARNTPFYSIGMISFLLCQSAALANRFSKIQQEMLRHREQLHHTEKLATLGTVVAGVAHEINNPNNSLLLDTQLNEKAWNAIIPIVDKYANENSDFDIGGYPYTEFKEEFAGLSDRMKRSSDRIRRITEDLRSFAKKDVVFNEDIDVNGTVRLAISVIEHVTMRSTRNLTVELSKENPHVKGSARYLEQVIINLVKNACQALPSPDKGVFITTTINDNDNDNEVTISVRDEGRGMDEKTIKNIFTPFYTTKGAEGTGLGLSICNNIIKSHGGRIEVESKLDKGTTIQVFLPAANHANRNPITC
jgi:signal transduction histidine kinase